MNKRMIALRVASLLLGSTMLVPACAYAVEVKTPAATVDTAAGASVNANAKATAAGAAAQVKVDAKLQLAKDKGDKEIDRRVQALGELNTRIDAMQRVTANFKQTLTTNIQNQITGLNQLKTKIDADTDVATLKVDVKTITDSYRIYMLVMPQARIAASADREVTLITMMNQLGAKLQARISAAQSAGSNVSALLAALTDMSTKLSDASTQSQAAVSVSAGLAPDAGDKTKQTQNAAALKTARADVQVAQKDLVAARKDAETIVKGLKSLPAVSASATTTVSSTTTIKH